MKTFCHNCIHNFEIKKEEETCEHFLPVGEDSCKSYKTAAHLYIINSDPIRTEYVCTIVDEQSSSVEEIRGYEIHRFYYKHPDAPEYAEVSQLEQCNFFCYKRIGDSRKAAPYILLEAMQKTIKEIKRNREPIN